MKDNDKEKNGFTFAYSAKEQAEIKRIREKYTPLTEAEDKMARLKRLDASVTQSAQIASLVLGIIGVLILGFGMSLILTDISELFAMQKSTAFVVGIVVGTIGGILASLAYPIYSVIIKAKRKKLAPEILRLTDELIK